MTLSKGRSRGAGRAVSQVPHKQHTNPHCARDPASVCESLDRDTPLPLTTRNAWEAVSNTSRVPMSPASTGSCHRLLPGRVWSCRLACRAGPRAAAPLWALAPRRLRTTGTQRSRMSPSPPGAAPETQGHRWEAPGQLLGTFCYFNIFK